MTYLYYLLYEPNQTAALNIAAAEEYQKSRETFRLRVREYIDAYCPK